MSYETILKDLPEDFIRKMRNWARSNLGGGMYAMTSAYDGVRSDGYDTQMPILDGEAQDVDAALMTVPNRFRQAVMLFWTYEGRELTWLARRLECDYRAVERRVRQGHMLVIAQLARQRFAADRYREAARMAAAC